ncbi:hypothetical protein [Muricoccus radiodurans]|uniref:hypothetical protein n=1 Tax=Muricoccus radiodurans TaxID=2231721 RepID=UPI003CFA74C9
MAQSPTGATAGRTDSVMLAEIVHHLSQLVEEQRRANALLERLVQAMAAQRPSGR